MRKKLFMIGLAVTLCLGLVIPAMAAETEVKTAEELQAALNKGWECWGLGRETAFFSPWDWERNKNLDVSALTIQVEGELRRGEKG